MKVMVLVKATRSSEAGELPTEQMFAEMTAYNEELAQAGILLAGEGLKPSKEGVRIRFSGEERSVIDGPFSAVNELVAGYWLWEVSSMEEAIAWARRCPNPMPEDSELEIRPLYEAADFGDASTDELREREERLREQVSK